MQWHVAHNGTCVDRAAAAMFLSMADLHAPQRSGHLDIPDLACNINRLSKEMAGLWHCGPGEIISLVVLVCCCRTRIYKTPEA